MDKVKVYETLHGFHTDVLLLDNGDVSIQQGYLSYPTGYIYLNADEVRGLLEVLCERPV